MSPGNVGRSVPFEPRAERRNMTGITRSSVPRHSLRAEEVIVRLQAGEHFLIDEIASRPYQRILELCVSEETITEWKEMDEKLKFALHTHIEVFGSLFSLEGSIAEVLRVDRNGIGGLLENLSGELHFLFLDFCGLFYDLGYPTWNLVDALRPERYGRFIRMPSYLAEVITGEERCHSAVIPSTWSDFADRLIAAGISPKNARATQAAVLEFLHWSRSYREFVILLYEAETGIDTLFALNAATAVAIRLMGISYSSRLVLSAIASNPALGSRVEDHRV